jgi:uncharacterized protein (UPF0261 family)
VTATTSGLTSPAAEAAAALVRGAGYEVRVFDASRGGGREMEALIRRGDVCGVLDVTTTDLAGERFGGAIGASSERLTAASMGGVPQVICPGGLDVVHCGPPEAVPARLRGRRLHCAGPSQTLVRTTPEDNDELGREIAYKASASRGPVAVLAPLRGLSALDAVGQPFWWPQADAALVQSLRHWMSPAVRLIELDVHINEAAFADSAARTLLALMGAARG